MQFHPWRIIPFFLLSMEDSLHDDKGREFRSPAKQDKCLLYPNQAGAACSKASSALLD